MGNRRNSVSDDPSGAGDRGMNRDEALEILTQYNDWRRSDYDANPRPIMPHPRDIGEAIDVAIGVLKTREVAAQEAAEMAATRPLRW